MQCSGRLRAETILQSSRILERVLIGAAIRRIFIRPWAAFRQRVYTTTLVPTNAARLKDSFGSNARALTILQSSCISAPCVRPITVTTTLISPILDRIRVRAWSPLSTAFFWATDWLGGRSGSLPANAKSRPHDYRIWQKNAVDNWFDVQLLITHELLRFDIEVDEIIIVVLYPPPPSSSRRCPLSTAFFLCGNRLADRRPVSLLSPLSSSWSSSSLLLLLYLLGRRCLCRPHWTELTVL